MRKVSITIRGPHDTGRSTLARIIEQAMLENGYTHVAVKDTSPLPREQKSSLVDRWERNRGQTLHEIVVETDE